MALPDDYYRKLPAEMLQEQPVLLATGHIYYHNTAKPNVESVLWDDTEAFKQPKPKRRRSEMRNDMLVFVASDQVKAVLVNYEPNDSSVMCKTTLTNLKRGDYCVVQSGTRHKMTIVRVEDPDCLPDFEVDRDIPWIIGRVETQDFQQLLDWEKAVIAEMRTMEIKKKREEMRQHLGVSSPQLTALPAPPNTAVGSVDED